MVSLPTRLSKIGIAGIFGVLLLCSLLIACQTKAGENQPEEERLQLEQLPSGNYTDLTNRLGRLGSVSVGGLDRHYYLYEPSSYTGDRPIPLVLAFHGGHTRPQKLASTTNFNQLAETEHFMVVYPEGINRHWQDGRNTPNFDSSIDDIAFVRMLIEQLKTTKNIDHRRIYATGISNGGFLTLKLACDLSETIAAFAPVAATLPVTVKSQCQPQTPVSILLMSGTDDRFVPWQGGTMRKGQQILSMEETLDFWQQHNNCLLREAEDFLPDTDPTDGTSVRTIGYSGCRGNSQVRLVTVRGGGHTWPGGVGQPPGLVGKTSRDINATEVIWNFFKYQALP